MKTGSGIGRLTIVVTLIGFLLLACSSPTQSPPALSGATSVKPYGSVVVGWSGRISTVDPFVGDSAVDYPGYLAGVLEGLTTLDSSANVVPGLAERWEISDDGLTQTFYLRKGVKFHDGSDLTGADVKFTMERMLAPDSTNGASSLPTWRGLAPQVEIKDDYTVVVRFKAPQYDVAKPIRDFSGVLAIVPKKYIEEKGVEYFRKNPIGSGPWKVVNFIPGQRIELEANEDYWDKTRIPKFKNITFIVVSDEATKVAMLKTGELDIADVSPESAAAFKAAGMRVKAWDSGVQGNYALLYDTKDPAAYAFGDLRVRTATSLAINRKELADTLFGGYAEPGIVNRVQRTAEYFDASVLKPDPYDPEGAKKLLAEAGYGNGFETKVWDVGGGSILSTFDQALTGYWRKVGINAAISPMDLSALVTLIRNYSDRRQVSNTVFPVGAGTTSWFSVVGFDIASSFSTRTGLYRNHTNKRLDDLIEQYPMTKDPAVRKQMAREATILAKNEYSVVSVLNVSVIWALGSKIGDLTPIQGWAAIGPVTAAMTHAK